MVSIKSPPPPADLAALAAEALDLWQEHLTLSANDPAAKAEMMRLMEPSRQAFADWAAIMQNAPHAAGTASKHAADGAKAAGPASDDGSLRLAQLALRVAELEKRVVALETRGAGKAAKTSAASGTSKS